MSSAPLGRDLVRVGPHDGAHRVALRAGVTVLVPLVVLLALDRLDLSLYATFGAFASLYGRQVGRRARAVMQTRAGLSLAGCVVAGTLTGLADQRSWLAPLGAALVAITASVLSDRQGWHPPGALFPVFAYAACASVPSTPGLLPVAAAVSLATVALAVAIGASDRLVGAPSAMPRPEHVVAHALRNGTGVLLAGLLATALGIGHPYWAMVGAAVPLGFRTTRGATVRGLQRLAGTAVGLVLAGVLLTVDPAGLVLVLIVAALQVAAEMVVGRNYALALVFVTPLALLMVHLAAPEPASELLVDRGVETLVGVVVGVLVGLVLRSRDAHPR